MDEEMKAACAAMRDELFRVGDRLVESILAAAEADSETGILFITSRAQLVQEILRPLARTAAMAGFNECAKMVTGNLAAYDRTQSLMEVLKKGGNNAKPGSAGEDAESS